MRELLERHVDLLRRHRQGSLREQRPKAPLPDVSQQQLRVQVLAQVVRTVALLSWPCVSLVVAEPPQRLKRRLSEELEAVPPPLSQRF